MMRLLCLVLLLPACMVDKTGQSATARLARDASLQAARLQESESLVRRLSTRLTELEEVMVYRGEQEELELENLEGIQMEIRRLRNDVEKLQRAETQGASATEAFRGDADARITDVDQRLLRLEGALGMSAGAVEAVAPIDRAEEAAVV